MCGIVELGQTTSSTRASKIDQDSFEHIVTCINILADPLAHSLVGPSYRALCRSSFQKLISVRVLPAAAALVLLLWWLLLLLLLL
jgi:hypothetical protein